MATQTEIENIKTNVAVLHNEMENISKYFDKLDNTVDKMQELLASMHRMITLHEERIGIQLKSDEEFKKLFETRKKETDDGFKVLVQNLEEVNKKIWKLDLKRATIVGSIIMAAFILGPIISGYFQAYFSGRIIK